MASRYPVIDEPQGGTSDPPRAGSALGHAGFRKILAALLVAVLAIMFFRMIAPFFQSLVLGAIFSGLVYPLYVRLRRYVHNDGIASVITTLGALVVFALPLSFLVGALTREAIQITEVVGPWVDRQTSEQGLFLTFPEWLPFADELRPYRAQILERAGEAVNAAGRFIVDSLSQATQGAVAFLLYLFVMLYAIFYFLMKGPELLALLSSHLPFPDGDKHSIAERGVAITRATLKSMLIIGALQGVLGGIAFAVVGIQGPVFWGLLMALASAIPVFGAALIWAPAAIGLLVGGDTLPGIGLALWGALVISSIDNLLRPHLVGSEARMPDLLVLVSTLGGLAMFGATGLLIGPVLAGVFLTSLDIFVATFRNELRDAPRIVAEPVSTSSELAQRNDE